MWHLSFLTFVMARQAGIAPIEQYVIDKVKEMRQEKGISQAALAQLMEVSEGFIGNVENPKYRAKYSLYHLGLLAKILQCSPKDFLPDKI